MSYDYDAMDDYDDLTEGLDDDFNPKQNLGTFLKGIKSGIKDRLFSSDTARTFLKAALPTGHLRAIEFIEHSVDEARASVDRLEVRNAALISNTVGMATEAMTAVKEYLPEATYQRVKDKLTEVKDEYREKANIGKAKGEEPDSVKEKEELERVNKELTNSLGEDTYNQIKAGNTLSQAAFKYQIKNNGLNGKLSEARFAILGKHLNAIGQGIAGVNETNKASIQIQQKALELQTRSYVALRAMVDISRKQYKLSSASFKVLERNTGMPDHAKQSLRQVVSGGFKQRVGESAADFAKGFGSKFTKGIEDKVNTAADMLGMTTGMGSMMLEEFKNNPLGKLGELAGSHLIDLPLGYAERKAEKHLKPKISKLLDSKLPGGEANINYHLDNLPSSIKELLEQHSQGFGIKANIATMLSGLIPKFQLDQSTSTNYDTLHQAAPFDQMSQRSLVDVIPGYLGRILQETRMIRTGRDDIPYEGYNLQQGTFTDIKTLKQSTRRAIVSSKEKTDVNAKLDEAIKAMGVELSPEATYALKERMIRAVQEGEAFDPSKYKSGYADNTDEKTIKEIQQAIEQSFTFDPMGKMEGNKANYERRQAISEKVNSLRDSIKNPVNEIDRLLATGNQSLIRDLGLVTDDSKLDYANIRKLYLEQELPSLDKDRGQPKTKLTLDKAQLERPSFKENVNSRVDDFIDRQVDKVKDSKVGELAKGKGRELLRKARVHARKTGQPLKEVYNEFLRQENKAEYAKQQFEELKRKGNQTLNETITKAKDKETFKPAFEKMDSIISDVKSSKTGETLIKASDFVTGKLRDFKTGKVIHSPEDIKGEVVNEEGNTVLTENDLAEGIVDDKGDKIDFVFGQGVSKAQKGKGFDFTNFKPAEMLRGALKRVKDLYLKGARSPILTARGFKRGDYVDKETGKVLETVDDISGDVIDRNNPDEVILTKEEAKNDLTDSSGAWIRPSKLLRTIMAGFQPGISILGLGSKIGLWAISKTFKYVTNKLIPVDAYLPDSDKPVLRVSVCKRGGYFFENGKPVKELDDLRSSIYDKEGNLILDEADIPLLVTRRGEKHPAAKRRSLLRRIVKASTIGLAKKALGGWWGLTKLYYKGLGKGIGLLGKGAKKLNDKLPKTEELLMGLLGLIDERFPKKARKGSAEDMLSRMDKGKRKQADRDRLGNKKKDEKSKGLLGSLMSMFKGRGGEEEDSDRDIDVDIDLGDREGRRGRRGRRGARGKGGRLGRMARGLGRGAKALGRGGLSLARGGLGLARSGVGLAARGAMMALPYAASGLASAASGIAAGASALTSGGIAAATFLLTNPVGWAILGVGALAAGGAWLWHRHKTTGGDIRSFRLKQYGMDSMSFWTRTTKWKKKVLEIEALLEPAVSKSNDPKIEGSRVNWEQLFQIAEIDKDNPKQTEPFLAWMDHRFKPIFLLHLKSLYELGLSQIPLNELDDKMPDDRKYEYFQKVTGITADIYKFNIHPFSPGDTLSDDSDEIVEKGKELMKKWKDKAKKEEGEDKEEGDKEEEKSAAQQTADTLSKFTPTGIAKTIGGKILSVQKGLLSWGKGLLGIDKDKSSWDTLVSSLKKGGLLMGALSGPGLLMSLFSRKKPANLTSLQAIRIRAYGKLALDPETVSKLFELEEEVYRNVKYANEGHAVFPEEKLVDILEFTFKLFNVDTSNKTTREARVLSTWLTQRFIPAALAFFTGIRLSKGNIPISTVETALDLQSKINVAEAIINATCQVGTDTVPIWKIDSFFINALFFSSSKLRIAADKELEKLKEELDKSPLDTPAMTGKEQEREEKGSGTFLEKASTVLTAGPIGLVKDAVATGYQKVKEGAGAAFSAVSNFFSGNNEAVESKDPIELGAAKGGEWEKVPFPEKNKDPESALKVLQVVSEMTGVPVELLYAFTKRESAFNYKGKAPTSTASGWFQFIKETWNTMLAKYGAKYGLPSSDPSFQLVYDPRANALMGAEFIKENHDFLKRNLKREPGAADLYAAHFLGASGANKLLSAPSDAPATRFVSPEAARANRNIFFKGGRTQTVGEVYQDFQRTMDSYKPSSEMLAKNIPTVIPEVQSIDSPTEPQRQDIATASVAKSMSEPLGFADASNSGFVKASTVTEAPITSGGEEFKHTKEIASAIVLRKEEIEKQKNQQMQQSAMDANSVMQKQLETQLQMRDLLSIIAAKDLSVVVNGKAEGEINKSPSVKQTTPLERQPANRVPPVSFQRV